MRKRKNIKKKKKPCEANWFFEKTHIIVAYKFDQEEKQEKFQITNFETVKETKFLSVVVIF